MSDSRFNSLSARGILAIVSLALAGVFFIVAIGHFQARALVIEQETREGAAMAMVLQAAVEGELDEPMQRGSDYERLVARLGEGRGLRNLFLIRANGEVLARGSSAEQPTMFAAHIPRVLQEARTLSSFDPDRQLFSFVVPIVDPSTPGAPVALLTFERSVADSLAKVWHDTKVRAAGALMIAIALALLLYVMLRSAVIRPAAALSRQADLLGAGDFSARSGITSTTAGSGEIHRLATAFDTMADRLEDLETKRLSADLMLRASEARYRAMVEGSHDLICRTLPDGRLTFANDAYCRHYGKTRDNLLDSRVTEVLPEQERAVMARVLAEHDRDGAATFEHRSVDEHGNVRWHLWSNRAVRDSEGGLLEYQAVGHDITARKLAEEKLQASNVDLEERVHQRTSDLEVAVRELESFSYAVAHDLRAPLRSIDGFGQILTERLGPHIDAESVQLLVRIRQRAQGMGTLIDDLLTLAEVARTDIERTRVDLSSAAADCISALRRAEPDRDVEVVIQPGMEASADADLLRIALTQLLDNAWKFTRSAERPRIEVGITRKLNQPVAYVRDNGAGFDMAYVERLFTAFKRLHSTSELSGSGIGLAIVQRIVKRHGGQVWAQSAPGEGATFFFTLAGA